MRLPELPSLPELPPVPTGPNLRLTLEERITATRTLLDTGRMSVDAAIDTYIVLNEELAMLQSFERIDQTLHFRITEISQDLERYFGARAL